MLHSSQLKTLPSACLWVPVTEESQTTLCTLSLAIPNTSSFPVVLGSLSSDTCCSCSLTGNAK